MDQPSTAGSKWRTQVQSTLALHRTPGNYRDCCVLKFQYALYLCSCHCMNRLLSIFCSIQEGYGWEPISWCLLWMSSIWTSCITKQVATASWLAFQGRSLVASLAKQLLAISKAITAKADETIKEIQNLNLYSIYVYMQFSPFAAVTSSTTMFRSNLQGWTPTNARQRLWPKHSSELGFQGVGIFPKVLQDQVGTKRTSWPPFEIWFLKQLHTISLNRNKINKDGLCYCIIWW